MNIKAKLLLPSLVGMCLFLGFLQFVWGPLQLEYAKSEFTERARQLVAASDADLIRSLLERDYAALHATLNTEVARHRGEWFNLTLYDDTGRKLYPLFAEQQALPSADNLIGIEHRLDLSGSDLGELRVQVDWSQARQHAEHSRYQLVWLVVGIMALLFLVNLVSIHQLLYVPLQALKIAANRLAGGDFEVTLPASAKDEIGELSNAFSHMRSELKASLGFVRNSEARQRAILETMGDGLLIIDSMGRIVSSNPSMNQLLGYPPDTLIGQPLSMLLPESVRERHQHLLQSADRDNGALDRVVGRTRHLRARHRDGHEIDIALNIGRFETAGETQYSVVIRDISEDKIAEQALIDARAEAESANRAKSDFLANMSHEIRTPMNAIIGMSHLALESELPARSRNYIDKVHRSAKSLLGIINDILDFSKIEAGKLDLESVPFDLDQSLGNVANIVGLKAEEKGLELLFHLDNDVPRHLVGDSLRLEQVLVNLGNNAVKFTDKGTEVVLKIETQERHHGQVLLKFSLTDSGIGMSPAQCEKLFQPFTQGDESTTRTYGGTGLGLSISRRLVELMGGDIWVESELKRGSTFYFTARFKQQQQPLVAPACSPVDLAKLNILVVDDNATSRRIFCDILSNLGTRSEAVSSGQEAIERLRLSQDNAAIDLVLMDWNMPGLDGIETTRRIQGDPLIRHTPTVIMVTAFGRDEAKHAAHDVDLAAVLGKPITSSNLERCIHACLSPHAPESHAPASEGSSKPGSSLRGVRLLVVEDNEFNQELAHDLLATRGIQVDIAVNGLEAIEKVNNGHYDGVLMDCQMPVLDGYAATRRLREDPRHANLPIIAMTANAMQGDRERVLAAGMNDHIAKPIDVRNLFRTLAKWIQPPTEAATTEAGPTAASSPDEDGDLPEFDCINAGKGLRRIDGDTATYLRFLRKFAVNQAKTGEQLQTALREGDLANAQRIAHTLKGISGSIGAEGLQQDCAKLEASLGETSPLSSSMDALLTRVQNSLRAVLDDLDKLPQDHAVSTAATLSEEEIEQHLGELRALLSHYDTSAVDELGILLNGVTEPALLRRLRAVHIELERYEFEQALEILAAQ